MRIQLTTTPKELHDAWVLNMGSSWDEFSLECLKNHIQIIHEEGDVLLFEGIVPDQPYEMRFGKALTADDIEPNLGTIERTTGEPPVKQEDQAARVARGLELKGLFDDVFAAAIQSGLLVDKAIIKASEAVSKADAIDAARNSAVLARISEEFGDDAP